MSLLFFLFTKHFICDFPLQAFPYMYRNKGTYGHAGGLLHAAIHSLGTQVVASHFTTPDIALACAAMDGVLHYHIDWLKMNLSARWHLTPTNSEWFWILLGLDQYLHACTYFVLALAIGG